jgi:hypothetical protein
MDVCKGMVYLHNTAGVIHRDLTPKNVLLDSAASAKIADFGVSRLDNPDYLTHPVGALPYVAPEVKQAKKQHSSLSNSKGVFAPSLQLCCRRVLLRHHHVRDADGRRRLRRNEAQRGAPTWLWCVCKRFYLQRWRIWLRTRDFVRRCRCQRTKRWETVSVWFVVEIIDFGNSGLGLCARSDCCLLAARERRETVVPGSAAQAGEHQHQQQRRRIRPREERLVEREYILVLQYL